MADGSLSQEGPRKMRWGGKVRRHRDPSPQGSAPQDPRSCPTPSLRPEDPLCYSLKLAQILCAQSPRKLTSHLPIPSPGDHGPPSPPLSSLTPSPAVETLTPASKTSSRVCMGQGRSRGGHGRGRGWGPSQPPPVPQFPGSS